MSTSSDQYTWRRQPHGSLIILKKNVLLYYLKPPVLIFGVLFPVFFFLAFKMGRSVSPGGVVPGMVAMALWFTATAIGPLVTPWERRAKTYERLISSPLSLRSILAGDVLSGFVFGCMISVIPVILGLLLTDAVIANLPLLIGGILMGALSFSSLGVLLSAPPAASPSNIMLLSSLVRLPLLFVSGIFVPIGQMPGWAAWVAPLSPLSYTSSLIRAAYGSVPYFPVWMCFLMLFVFTSVLFIASCLFHNMYRAKGL
ncbi:MAG: ABC transporter permease [Candidatus Aegiribacteria sp.]|nr:ABC transporter permease [Candidatus Aegiribacteria sp.]